MALAIASPKSVVNVSHSPQSSCPKGIESPNVTRCQPVVVAAVCPADGPGPHAAAKAIVATASHAAGHARVIVAIYAS